MAEIKVRLAPVLLMEGGKAIQPPLSADGLFSDPAYLHWARGHFGDREVAQLMLKTLRAVLRRKCSRDEIIKVIAKSFDMDDRRLANMINRSSTVIPKRRRTVSK
jgi:hypothetical protein